MSGELLLTRDADLPEVQLAPAPWRLNGEGWILLLRLPGDVRNDTRHIPPALRGCALSGPSMVMFVDYADSPAGPYRELLYIPGRFTLPGGRRAWSVTRIYVSSWDSVVNGRLNWGIPKDHAVFMREPAGRGAAGERIRVEIEGRRVATLELRARGPAMPVYAGLLPASLRRLAQYHAGRRFEFAPGASGRAGPAQVSSLESDPALFPDLSGARVKLALRVPAFSLQFPLARISSSA